MKEKDRVLIFDTTMRDGEQALGRKMSPETKVKIARGLERLNVDIIEVGYACSSPAEMEAIRKVSMAVQTPVICSLAGVKQDQIEAAARSLELAKKARIHVFVSTSDLHIEQKLRWTREMVLEAIDREVRRARTYFDDVEFSPEDATRTDREFLLEAIQVAVDAGANTINIPDTCGYAQEDFGDLIGDVYELTPPGVVTSVHCHDDLGQAVANSLHGIGYGARQVEGCFLGIGERAGNAALEEVIAAIHTRHDFHKVVTGINLKEIGPFCRLLSKLIDYPIPAHKAIIGERAVAHSAGIHVAGVLRNRETYEILKREDLGLEKADIQLVSHLGRTGLQKRLEDLGYDDAANLTEAIHDKFKEFADHKGRLTEDDLHMLVQEYLTGDVALRHNLFVFEPDGISYSSDSSGGKGAIKIRRDRMLHSAEASGDGPVNALCNAIDEALSLHGEDIRGHEPVHFSFTQGAGGSEAVGWMTVKIKLGDRIGFGRGGSTDMVKACAIAYLDAINHMFHAPVSNEAEMLRKVYE